MSESVPFTDNYSDISNENGYQFEFFCERCGSGYRSPFDASALGMGASIMRAAGGMFGGMFGRAAHGADELNRMTNSKAKDKALVDAVKAVTPNFRQCHACGNWYCHDICWNDETNQCVSCTPKLQQEITRMQAQAQVDQVGDKIQEVDWTTDVDYHNRAPALCPSCGAEAGGGKFCQQCGGRLAQEVSCGRCGTTVKAGAKFCPECGDSLL